MTKSSAVAAVLDYVQNPQKTDDGRLINSYSCDSRTAADEFLLSKKEYDYKTGRSQGKHDVIAYHIRQSFKPGEVTPEEAGEIGRKLALSFTKGHHAFVVATHIDKAHVHNHIIFNSTFNDCERKFKDFYYSGRALRRISDLLCAEHGLSVIENPTPSKGSYADWLGDKKEPSHTELLKRKIDEILPSCGTFNDFIAMLTAQGYQVDTKRKHISVKAPEWKKPKRLNTLGGEYTEEAIRARIGQREGASIIQYAEPKKAPSLLIDIQAKIREGKGAGYAQWAKIFNLKEAAKTLLFLRDNGINSYEDLVKKSAAASGDFTRLTARIKEIETRQKEIAELQKEIGIYGKTRDVYAKYKASGWSRDFYDVHSTDIILHRAAKKHFDGLGMKKLPSINLLKQEWGTLAAERRTLYGEYQKRKDESRKLAIARENAARLLGIAPETQNRDVSHAQHRSKSHEK